MLKLKILLANILRKYKINSNLTEDDYKLQADIILKRTDGFRIEIEPRKKISTTKTSKNWTEMDQLVR